MSNRCKDTYINPANTRDPQKFPDFSKPCIVGHFSVDKDRQYIPSSTNLQYITNTNVHEPVKYDLNHGYENVVRKPANCVDEKLKHLLMFISQNVNLLKNEHEDPMKLLSVDVVCFRGLLRLIMCTPYESREPWTILATKYRGTIYLCAQETEKSKRERLTQNETTKRILSYGFKFEQYMMSSKFISILLLFYFYFIFFLNFDNNVGLYKY